MNALGTGFAINMVRKGNECSESEIPIMATLVLIGTSLSARMAAQGVEQALFSTVIEYCLNGTMRKVVSALVGR